MEEPPPPVANSAAAPPTTTTGSLVDLDGSSTEPYHSVEVVSGTASVVMGHQYSEQYDSLASNEAVTRLRRTSHSGSQHRPHGLSSSYPSSYQGSPSSHHHNRLESPSPQLLLVDELGSPMGEQLSAALFSAGNIMEGSPLLQHQAFPGLVGSTAATTKRSSSVERSIPGGRTISFDKSPTVAPQLKAHLSDEQLPIFAQTLPATSKPHMIESDHQKVHLEEDLHADFYGYRSVWWKIILYYVGILLTGGILYLVARWFPRLKLWLTAQPCPLRKASMIMVENSWRQREIVPVHAINTANPLYDIYCAFPSDEVSSAIDEVRKRCILPRSTD